MEGAYQIHILFLGCCRLFFVFLLCRFLCDFLCLVLHIAELVEQVDDVVRELEREPQLLKPLQPDAQALRYTPPDDSEGVPF